MAEHVINQDTWARAEQFRFFRTFDRPHYAATTRIGVTSLMRDLKPQGVSPYRACLFAIATGLHAVPELCMRFRGDHVVRHDRIALSMTVPTEAGSFAYAYVPYDTAFERFDARARQIIADTARKTTLDPNSAAQDAVAYLSCLPWMDYTAFNNAMPGPDDCIPRVNWGKIVNGDKGFDMAMTIEVHHALVDGAHVGAFFEAVQSTLDTLSL